MWWREERYEQQRKGLEIGERDGSKRIRTRRREEKSTEDGCLQKWKHPEQCVKAMTSKALTYF